MSVRKERSKGLFKASKQRGILEGAVKVMTEKGIENFSMDEVKEEAGVAKGTLYYYFPSKESLVDSAIKATLSPLGEELDTLFSGSITPLKKIEYLMLRMLGYFDKNREFFRVLLYVSEQGKMGTDRPCSIEYGAFLERIARVIEEGIVVGQFKRLDSFKTAALLLEASIAMISQRYLSVKPDPVEEDVGILTEIFINGIRNDTYAR